MNGNGHLFGIRGLLIDPDTRKVFVNEAESVLTTKEFDLLYFIASHPGRVFSKEHLFERIWGIDAMGDLQTVTVHTPEGKIRLKVTTSVMSSRNFQDYLTGVKPLPKELTRRSRHHLKK